MQFWQQWRARLARWMRRVNQRVVRWWSPPLGIRGERLAARFLDRNGFRVIETQFRNQFGEVDLVAVLNRTVVFVEVKTRRSMHAGPPLLAVDTEKQRRVARVALAYMKRHDLMDYPSRFDVVSVSWIGNSKPQISHLEDAWRSE